MNAMTLILAAVYAVESPNGEIKVAVDNGAKLEYSVEYRGKTIVGASPMGFEFVREQPMDGNFEVLETPRVEPGVEEWTPVVRAKHAHCRVEYNSLVLKLREKGGDFRRMDVALRVMDDAVSFRYTLYGSRRFDYRRISRELTGFAFPSKASAWMSNFAARKYCSSQEGEFVRTPIVEQDDVKVKGLPYLVEIPREDGRVYAALLDANRDGWPAYYIGRGAGRDGRVGDADTVMLGARLSPFGDDDEKEIKALFADRKESSWRVIMIGDNPGLFLESEVVRSLNAPCAIADASEWVKPGISAWDTWWSREDAVTLEEAKKFVDLAAAEGWKYMLVDWKWYGKFNHPSAVPLKCAETMKVPALVEYAKPKNVGIWVWMHSGDISQGDNWREAFALYERWGVKGVKIDFMDHDNQFATEWYRKILAAAAKHHLMVDFHGAYMPDGLERTYPNLLTREGVMGAEYSKFSERITPEHNVTLAFTRLLAGAMDYTPGGFLNVTKAQFKRQSPTLVMNTRAQELAKFVVYESPLTVFAEHPDNCRGKPGMDFLSEVPTVWDDIRFLGGYPGEHVELAKKTADGRWFVAGMNNSQKRTIELKLDFLPALEHRAVIWRDGPNAAEDATDIVREAITLDPASSLTLDMAPGGGFVMVIDSSAKQN